MTILNQKSTREIRAARTRQAILDAGLEILRTDGLENVSLRAIAKKIDYSAAAIYEYFNNKEELLAAMTQIIGEHLNREMLNRIKNCTNAADQIEEVGIAVINFAVNYPNEYALFSSQPFSPNQDSSESGCDGSSFELLTGFINEGLKSGLIKNPDGLTVEELAIVLWGVVHGLASLQNFAFKEAGIDHQRINQAALRIIMNGLR